MKTELVNNIGNESMYQLQYCKNLYLAHKKLNKLLLLLFSTINFCLIAFFVYFF